MAQDGEDWNGLETVILKTLAIPFKNTNGDVAPLKYNSGVSKYWQQCSKTIAEKRIPSFFFYTFSNLG